MAISAAALSDEKNPEFIFSMTDTTLLCAAVNGQLDLLKAAKRALAARGLERGEWVGFAKAKLIHGVK